LGSQGALGLRIWSISSHREQISWLRHGLEPMVVWKPMVLWKPKVMLMFKMGHPLVPRWSCQW
jgi:hypothetical protein